MKKEDSITMTQREQQRAQVLTQVIAGHWSAAQGAEALGMSERHLRRLKAAYEARGPAALAHGNRGKATPRRTTNGIRQQVATLLRETYAGCNDSHVRDLLASRDGIVISRKTVGRIREEAAIPSVRKRRRPCHRSRRDRMPQAGMLLQLDGSQHHWFGPALPRVTLLAAIDDATSTVVAAVFRGQEDAHGYLLLLRQVLLQRGVPLELYHDRHSIFQRNPAQPWSIEEQLRGRPDPTQFGQALMELGITSIAASSPQAKGRIERLWGTFQDRLVAELRLYGITDLQAANAFLPAFLERHNARFSVHADDPGQAYRPLDPTLDLDRVLSFRYRRVVANDNTVQFAGRVLQIPPGSWHRSYARARVTVHELLDGGLGVWYQGGWLLRTTASALPPTLRARRRPSARTPANTLVNPVNPAQLSLPTPKAKPSPNAKRKPAPDHPWRTQRLTNRPPAGEPRTESLSS